MNTLYTSQMDTAKPDFKRRIFCVEYPGRVNNINNMLDTLGGPKAIGSAYSAKNRRVELRFRPADVYCKPVCGDRCSTIGLLIKVKVKKKIRDPNLPCTSRDSEMLHSMTFTTSLMGVVDTIYKFENLCEYQYLPIDRINLENPDDMRLQCIHDRLFPSDIPDVNWLQQNDVPYFLTPPAFSRFDTIHFYSGEKIMSGTAKKEKIVKRKEVPHTHTIGRTRKRRQNYGVFLKFSDNNVPHKPNPEALKLLTVKLITDEQRKVVQQLFEERPIWSKNGILFRTPFNNDQLKFVLPTVAYYFTTGPWRVMWCKFGHDPKKDPKSLLYQTFDFRVKQQGLSNSVKPKRSYTNYLLPYKSTPSSRPKVVIMNRHSITRAFHEAKNNDKKQRSPLENTCVFRPGYVPQSRQMFYQYCDVLVPEIQTMLQELVSTIPSNAYCDKNLGFLPTGFDAKCREIVTSLVMDELRKNIDVTPSTSSQPDVSEEIAEESMDEYEENEDSDSVKIIESDVEEDMDIS